MENTREYIKTDLGIYLDLIDYINILKINTLRFESNYKWAKYKTLLFALRVLICQNHKGCNLLGRFANKRNFIPYRRFPGKKNIPKSNPMFMPKILSYQDYIDEIIYTNMSNQFSRKDFIWELSSQDGSHSDEGLSQSMATGYLISINDRTANERLILSTAKTIMLYGLQVINEAKKDFQFQTGE